MSTCETCAHWKDDWADDHDGGQWHYTQGPTLYSDGGEAMHDADFHPVIAPGRWGHCEKVDEFGPRKDSKFYVVDGSEYVASLYTRSDFGCTEYEPCVIADDLPSGPNPGIANPDFETSTDGWSSIHHTR